MRGISTHRGDHTAVAYTRIPFGVALEDVLEEGGTLLLGKGFVVGARQPGVEHVFNGELELFEKVTKWM